MSDTPRTDAAVAKLGCCTEDTCLDTTPLRKTCARLERELAEAKHEKAELVDALKEVCTAVVDNCIDPVDRQRVSRALGKADAALAKAEAQS